MARSPDVRHLALVALAAVLLCDAGAPASAAPATPEERAARKKKRQEARDAAEKPAEKPAKKSADRPGKQPVPPDAPTRPGTGRATPSTAPLPPCPQGNTLTWRSFGAGFLLTWCTGCHSSHLGADARQDAPDGVNFDTLANFKPHAGIAHERAVLDAHAFLRDPNSASPMPPAGLPADDDRRRFAQWIACGTP